MCRLILLSIIISNNAIGAIFGAYDDRIAAKDNFLYLIQCYFIIVKSNNEDQLVNNGYSNENPFLIFIKYVYLIIVKLVTEH